MRFGKMLALAALVLAAWPLAPAQAGVRLGFNIGIPLFWPAPPPRPAVVYVAPPPVYVAPPPAPVYVVPAQQPVYAAPRPVYVQPAPSTPPSPPPAYQAPAS
jgi:hypothetical protein